MTQIESIIQPDCVLDYFGWEAMAFVRIVSFSHLYIIAQSELTWQHHHLSDDTAVQAVSFQTYRFISVEA